MRWVWRRRIVLGVAFACAALLTVAPASLAVDRGSLQFSVLPTRAIAGHPVTVSVSRARPGAQCSLAVKYGSSTGTGSPLLKMATNGKATWSWTIPDTVQADVAKLDVACVGSHRLSGKLLVVGSLIPPRISVEKDGFSIRTNKNGSSDVSYGVMIKNDSPNADALDVSVLVNFVLADDHLIGSSANRIPVIAAGSTYALGNHLGFPGAAPVARLEFVIQVGSSTRHAGHPPALDNIVIEPSTFEPGWVGDVAGEVVNNDSSLELQRVRYSAVIFDAVGNVLGGGNGSGSGSLPPGTRMVFKATSGFRAIPFEKAASVEVSAIPTWQPAGA